MRYSALIATCEPAELGEAEIGAAELGIEAEPEAAAAEMAEAELQLLQNVRLRWDGSIASESARKYFNIMKIKAGVSNLRLSGAGRRWQIGS